MPAKVLSRDPQTQQVTAIRCRCGAKVSLEDTGGYDVDCDRCGQPYNCFGQALSRGHGDCFCPECC